MRAYIFQLHARAGQEAPEPAGAQHGIENIGETYLRRHRKPVPQVPLPLAGRGEIHRQAQGGVTACLGPADKLLQYPPVAPDVELQQLRPVGGLGYVFDGGGRHRRQGIHGASLLRREQALEYGDFDCFLLAGRYTLLEQGALDTFLPRCEARNVSVIIGGVYNSNVLVLGTRSGQTLYYNYESAPALIIERVQRLETVCDEFQAPLPAAALQFPLAHPAVASVIVGTGNPQRVAHTRELFNHPIPADFWQALRDEDLLHPDAPVPVNEALTHV